MGFNQIIDAVWEVNSGVFGRISAVVDLGM